MKTSGSHRTPPIPAYLYEIIWQQIMWKQKMRAENPGWGENDYLFVSESGTPYTPHQYGRAFKQRCPNAALISSIMGNSVKTLLQFYAQTDTEMQAGIVDNYLRLNG